MAERKGVAFFERGSWYHRFKLFQEDGTTRYSKKGGFESAKAAEQSYRKYEAEYKKAYRAYHAASIKDLDLKEYLVFWLDEIYRARVENTTYMLASYVIYDLLFPNMEHGIKLRHMNVEYLDSLLEEASKSCVSAGNKCRELLNVAMKDAVADGFIHRNLVQETKPYRRKKPKIVVLGKEKMKLFLEKASDTNWYLEILLGLFMGLRKGEISGLKFSDIDVENRTLRVERQITADPYVEKGGSKIVKYRLSEKEPKTMNSYRVLRVPEVIMDEILKRKRQNDLKKEKFGKNYIDNDYLSCAENGAPHSASALNNALTKLCSRNGLPHLTVHSLRHMYATILTEQGVPLVKVSALLGHSSVHTTFEYYCEVMDENEKIIGFMNDSFVPEGGDEDV